MNVIPYAELTPELARQGCMVLDMPNEAYHAYDGLSNSGLKQFLISPAHYAYAEPTQRTRFMVIGEALHKALLEPELFKQRYMLLRDIDDRRKTEYKQAIKEFDEDLVLVKNECRWIDGMQRAVEHNADMLRYLRADGMTEVSVFATCRATGVLIKARFDRLADLSAGRVPFDLKKTQSIAYRDAQNSIARYGYHIQDAFYRYVYECATGQKLPAMRFGMIEEKSPHASKVYTPDTLAQQQAERIVAEALPQFAECQVSGVWPYPDGSEEAISLPAWAEDYDEQEII